MVILDLISPVENLLAALALFLAAKRSCFHSRRLFIVWALFALAQLSYTLGDGAWSVLEAGLGQHPFPSVADWFYLAYYPLFLGAVLHLPTRMRLTRGDKFKSFLDIAVIMIVSGVAFWNFLIGPLSNANIHEPLLSQTLSLAYPVGDLLLLLALLMLLYLRSSDRGKGPYTLLTIGVGFMILADSLFVYQSLSGFYLTGGFLDLGWTISYLLAGLAGILQAVTIRPESAELPALASILPSRKVDSLLAYLSYLWLVAAFGLVMFSHSHPLPMSFSTISILVWVITGLVLFRQSFAIRENNLLNHQLRKAKEDVEHQAAALEKANLGLTNEIYERKRAEERLSYDALHDGLTGLPNRVLFLDRLGRAIEYMKRKTGSPFSVLFLDLDCFKVINDSLGHSIGDQLLIDIAQRLTGCLRSSDTVARLGGDEFVILLENGHTTDSVESIILRIFEALKPAFYPKGYEIYVTASIGVVRNVASYTQPEEVLRDADIAMYQAKAMGKARFEIFSPDLRTVAITRMELEKELRRALEHGELELYYQPIVSLLNDQITGFEALIRWNHPQKGLVYPAAFISIAEDSGLIIPIGRWVLYEACSQMQKWKVEFFPEGNLAVNVNVSGKQLIHPEFLDDVQNVLKATGLSPDSLKCEITETVLMNYSPLAREVFNRLHDLGVQLEIDDFGTGYSSLSYLQHFPVQTLKIDKSFISEMGKTGKGSELVRAIVVMARDLGLETIAEGVETDSQLSELKKLNCNFGQGFLLAKPAGSKVVEELLRERLSAARG
jgi:diguanylate cyclase (GGDEF)-like protein